MIPEQELTAERRDLLRAGFASRMKLAVNPEWRRFWETELLFLDSRYDEAVTQLRELAMTDNRQVAAAALMSLGEWYEQSGLVALAQQAYAKVTKTDGGRTPTVLASAKLARLHNKAHEPALAAAALESAAAVVEQVAADSVQFLVVEYCQALRDLGRVSDARTFVQRAIEAFPDRTELPLIEKHLFHSCPN